MKRMLIIIALLMLCADPLFAQELRSYIAVVKRKSAGDVKGVLYHVTSNAIVLDVGDTVIAISPTQIKRIKIFASKKPYKYKKIFSYDPWDDSNFERLPNEVVPRRKFGEPHPTIEEEIAGYLGNAAMNGAVNLIVAPFSTINASIFNKSINQDLKKFESIREDLYKYSIYYQMNTDYKDELDKMNSVKDRIHKLPPSK